MIYAFCMERIRAWEQCRCALESVALGAPSVEVHLTEIGRRRRAKHCKRGVEGFFLRRCGARCAALYIAIVLIGICREMCSVSNWM